MRSLACVLFLLSVAAAVLSIPVPCPNHCKVVGDGLKGGLAGDSLPITIQSYDCDDKPLTQGGYAAHFAILFTSNGLSRNYYPVDNGDGTYSLTIRETIAGSWTLSVQLFDAKVDKGQYSIDIHPGPISGANCEAVSSNGFKVYPYEKASFRIQARDSFGNLRTDSFTNGTRFTVTLLDETSNTTTPLQVVAVGDGTWSVSYMPWRKDSQSVAVAFGGTPIHSSPFSLTFLDARPYAPNCIAYEADGHNGLIGVTAGDVGQFTIEAKDAVGNRVTTGGAQWLVTLTGPQTLGVACFDHHDGMYVCSFSPTIAGRYRASIVLQDTGVAKAGPIQGSPFSPLVIADDAFVPNSHAYGHNLHNAETDEEAVFFIAAYDRFGNPATVGGEYFNVLIKGPDCTFANQTDFHNGTYAFAYMVSKDGDYKVYVHDRGVFIPGSPFDLHVESPSGHHSGLSGGAIAGIVIGCVAFAVIVVVLVVLVVVIMRRRRSQITYDSVS